MHDIQRLHVSHLPVEEFCYVDQLYGNGDKHGITESVRLVLLSSIAQN